MKDRELALDALVRGKDPEAVRPLIGLLAEPALRGRALKALGAFDHPSIPGALVARWAEYDEGQRNDAVSTLTSRAAGTLALLDAMERGEVPRAVLTAFELRKIAALGDAAVDARLTEVWGVVRPVAADKEAEIARWTELLTPERVAAADRAHGRDVFARTCARCHTLFGEGLDVGPDITGANRGDLAYLLQNMVDPNAVIPAEYQVTIVATTDGRILTGILEEDREDAIVLRTENERVVLARDEVEASRPDPNSMMPVGQLDTLSEDEVAALVAYLQGDAQAPRRATPDNVGEFFDGETLAGWSGDPALWSVEGGEIVGRTDGLAKNAFLVSDLELGDFRLLLEVKLTPNSENSGVQLRSHPTADGSVKGYQADVGEGRWGNLYDEHGRGLLVDAQELQRAKPDEWNRYEIVAVGDRVLTAINGVVCVDYTEADEDRGRGQVALQIHSGGALEVRFRVLALELDPAPELRTVEAGR